MFNVAEAGDSVELDGCTACQFFWFDGSELSRLGVVLNEPAQPEMNRAMAELELETLRQRRDGDKLATTVRDMLLWWWS